MPAKGSVKALVLLFLLIGSLFIFNQKVNAQTSGCTKTVSKGGGADYTSIQAGINGISSGQTLCVKGGNWKYEEAININKANITVKAHPDTPTPVLDGRYHRGLLNNGKVPFAGTGNYLPGYTFKYPALCPTVKTYNAKAMVSIAQSGVTFDGFIIQNIAGHGIGVGANNVTVKNNKLYWIHNTGIVSNDSSGNMHSIKILDNTVLFASVFSIDPVYVKSVEDCRIAQGKEPNDPASGIIKFGNLDGGMLVSGNYLAYGYGEGINIGKDNNASASDPIIIEKNVIHDSRHKIINTNNSRFVHIRNNLAFSPDPMISLGGRRAGGPFEILDEVGGNSEDLYFYNNITVNTEKNCFRIGGRESIYRNIYIGFNTFIGGPNTDSACISTYNRKPQNVYGIFENNIIYASDYDAFDGESGNIHFRNNLWYPLSKAPTGGMFGTNSLKIDPKLIDPESKIQPVKFPGEQSGTYLNFTDLEFLPNGFQIDINVNKYKLGTGSPAINAASARTAVGGFTPPIEAYQKDFFGNARGSNPDIGAHEFDGSQPPPPSSSPSPTPRNSPSSRPSPSDQPTEDFDYDLNDDGSINIEDLKMMAAMLVKNTIQGFDTNGDGKINALDFAGAVSVYDDTSPSPRSSPISSASPRSSPRSSARSSPRSSPSSSPRSSPRSSPVATPPTGQSLIVFTAEPPGGNEDDNEIYTIHPDGSNLRRLTTNNADDQGAVISPDRTKIAFKTNRDDCNASGSCGGNYNIYVMNSDGTNPTRLTDDPAHDQGPSWSPDGSKIAFGSQRSNGFHIYIMNANGSNQTKITQSGTRNRTPNWHPSQNKIAFTCDGPTLADGGLNTELCVINTDGTGMVKILGGNTQESVPSWSPDGSKILYKRGENTLRIMNADTTNDRQVINSGKGGDWSPDGLKIIFDAKLGNDTSSQMYIANSSGDANIVRVTGTPPGHQIFDIDWR